MIAEKRKLFFFFSFSCTQTAYLRPGGYSPDWSCQQHIATASKGSHKQRASNTNVYRFSLLLCLQSGHSHLSEARVQVEIDALADSCAK